MLIARKISSSPDEIRDEDDLGIRWWLLIPVLGLLGFLGWGFLYVYCEPKPSEFQVLIFLGLLALIFFETISAGFYNSDA
jgi:hypothetical protein